MPAPPPIATGGFALGKADELFRAMGYFIVWYDQTYPYGEFTGYQEYLSKLFFGVPIKIENDYQRALRQLNKSYSNTKYILIATGTKKKRLVQEVHNNATLERVYVIKPFVEKVMKWGHSLSKFRALHDFSELVKDLQALTVTYRPAAYRYQITEKLVDYPVVPDPMIMGEQTVNALRDEIGQEEDQMKFKWHYGIVLRIMKGHFADCLKKCSGSSDEVAYNPFSDLVSRLGLSVTNDSTEQMCKTWVRFLELAMYFDECKYISSGTSIDTIKELQASSSGEDRLAQLVDTINTLGEELERTRTIDEADSSDSLKQFHDELCAAVFFLAGKAYGEGRQWKGLYMMRALMHDIDLCIKLFLHLLLEKAESFADFHYYVLHSAIVSDTRVSAMVDLWEAWKDQDIPAGIALPENQLKEALHAVKIKNVVLINTSGGLNGLIKTIPAEYTTRQYFLSRDFVVDWEGQERLQYAFCYFVIEPSLTSSEYNKILDTCISRAITPLFVLYIPADHPSRIAKEMLKGRWTVTLVYCNTFAQIMEYIGETENNINRDLLQYSKSHETFKARVTGKSAAEGKQGLSGDAKGENDAGWEVLSTISQDVVGQLVEELSLGTKLVGSLHYYVLMEMIREKKQSVYWQNYAPLFGISNKYTTILDVNCAKTLLRAYTLQAKPPFYKMLNDAFRAGNPDSIAKYRAFFSMLHDEVKKGILKKHVGFVYRGTYFDPQVINGLKVGARVVSNCFTSTSKSQFVAREFARKSHRNVLLEIELDAHANSNVDIHGEKCSRYPKEEEVLLLPFSNFEIRRIFKEEGLTLLSLKEIVPEYELVNLKGIEYYN